MYTSEIITIISINLLYINILSRVVKKRKGNLKKRESVKVEKSAAGPLTENLLELGMVPE